MLILILGETYRQADYASKCLKNMFPFNQNQVYKDIRLSGPVQFLPKSKEFPYSYRGIMPDLVLEAQDILSR